MPRSGAYGGPPVLPRWRVAPAYTPASLAVLRRAQPPQVLLNQSPWSFLFLVLPTPTYIRRVPEHFLSATHPTRVGGSKMALPPGWSYTNPTFRGLSKYLPKGISFFRP